MGERLRALPHFAKAFRAAKLVLIRSTLLFSKGVLRAGTGTTEAVAPSGPYDKKRRVP